MKRRIILIIISLLFIYSSVNADFSDSEKNIIINKVTVVANEVCPSKFSYTLDEKCIYRYINSINYKLSKTTSNKGQFLLNVFKKILQDRLFSYSEYLFKVFTYSEEEINQTFNKLNYFDKDSEYYILTLDKIFAMYRIVTFYEAEYYSMSEKVERLLLEGLEGLKQFPNYDNHDYYVGIFSKYLYRYYDFIGDNQKVDYYLNEYTKYKDLLLNRPETKIPLSTGNVYNLYNKFGEKIGKEKESKY